MFNDRLRFEGPCWGGHYDRTDNFIAHTPRRVGLRQAIREMTDNPVPRGGHGGDEYGNCTLYFRCPLFGIVWWYPQCHYQTEVEVPDPGTHPWIDRVEYPGWDD